MVLAAAHRKASGTEIIVMAPGRRKLSHRESSFGGWARGDVREASQSSSLTGKLKIFCMGLMLILTSYPHRYLPPKAVVRGGLNNAVLESLVIADPRHPTSIFVSLPSG
jgi:hypothetical protein